LSPVISVSGDPFSKRSSSAAAIAESFIVVGEAASKSYTRRPEGGREARVRRNEARE
jgi:hypothetical protein